MNTSHYFFSNERTSDMDYLYFSYVLSSIRKKTDLKTAKKSLLLKVHSLEMAIRECNIINAIQAVNKHVQAAITMLEALREDSDKILPVKKISPNANSERQTTFFSIKKKRRQHFQSHRDRIATYVNQRLQGRASILWCLF